VTATSSGIAAANSTVADPAVGLRRSGVVPGVEFGRGRLIAAIADPGSLTAVAS
jgi:hypothetical protein